LLFGNNELKNVAEAVSKDKRLTVAVVGTGSSILAGPDGPRSAYPARSRRRSNGGFLRSTSRSSASPEAG
jgi:hypothetical protein